MNGLYPIIRRRRVPLVVLDAPPVAVGNVEPVPVEVKPGPAKAGTTNPSDAKAAPKRKAR